MARGRLVFKGENAPKKKSSKSKHKTSSENGGSASTKDDGGAHEQVSNTTWKTAASGPAVAANPTSIAPQQPQIRKGKGHISSSGTVITGHNTKFSTELNAGDAIIIYNESHQEEMRIVTMRLSDTACGISSAFSNDCKSLTEFYYIPKPRNKEAEEKKRRDEAAKQKEAEDQSAFGTYSRSDTLVYHEKSSTGTSYNIRTENLEREVTRSELLNMRSKKKSDKYCH